LLLSDSANKDEIVAYADVNASGVFDPTLDAIKLSNRSTLNFSYTLSDSDYAIKAVKGFKEQTVLPLTIIVPESGLYTLTPEKISLPGLTAYLKDSLDANNIIYTNFTDGPITLTLNGGQIYRGRYSVVFESSTSTGVAQIDQDQTRIYSYGNKVFVKRSSVASATISIIDLLGQDMTNVVSHTQENEFELPVIEPWYAIVKVTEGQKVTIKKVLISNKQ